MPQKPTFEAKIAARMKREAILAGHCKGDLPEVGKRIALKPEKVRRIKELAAQGKYIAEIARELGQADSGIRRFVKDYGIKVKKGPPGGSPDGVRAKGIILRQKRVESMINMGMTQRAIAKALNVSVFTINHDVQYLRYLGRLSKS